MHQIFFENVRCFSSRQVVPLAPLTILVGENSSGKSTALALIRLAWEMAMELRTPNFNQEPFLLGAYDQIISDGKKGGKRRLLIGLEVKLPDGERLTVTGECVAKHGQPALTKLIWDFPCHQLVAEFEQDKGLAPLSLARLSVQGPSGRRTQVERKFTGDLKAFLKFVLREFGGSVGEELTDYLVNLFGQLGERPFAFAPIRTRPSRTYDPIKALDNPEGSHVPMFLASTTLRESSEWKDVIVALDDFGRQSGLFEDIEVRRLGQSESDPFQIRVHVGGNIVNVIDVGYGVSQVLPIVVDSLRGERGGTFLLQQPEVHLHPKAQAELGSFLGALAKRQEKQFVIETHSDYLVDRIRMDIRDNRHGLKPEDVSLLYFERRNGEAQIHRLELDGHGNIINAPLGYRNFFLEEERRFLGG
ncbi:MAG TPA: DUF3696 domain-containing protein [Thermoanaerobaculia bacterium]|jgi:predicted ATPase|nr:DUF3696 domain-containing protein [Thermoanaerobaculia bacterium]